MCGTAYLFGPSTPFPGYLALLPTLGCCLVLLFTHSEHPGRVYQGLSWLPLRYIGGISYSIYLWHWPIIEFFHELAGRSPDILEGIGIFAATIILSHLTKSLVEDKFRTRPCDPMTVSALPLIAVVGACLSCMIALHIAVHIMNSPAQIREFTLYPGAESLVQDARVPEAPIRPNFANALKDNPEIYARGCHLPRSETEPRLCRFNEGAPSKIFLIGDSHAASWQSTLKVLAFQYNFELVVTTKSACSPTVASSTSRSKVDTRCGMFSDRLLDILSREVPDLVILTQSERYSYDNSELPEILQGHKALLGELTELVPKVVVLRDVLFWPENPVDCAQRDRRCSVSEKRALTSPMPLFSTALEVEDVLAVDMTESFCRDGICPAVIGNILIWRDEHHFTQTYGRTIAPLLAKKLGSLLGSKQRSASGSTREEDRVLVVNLTCDATARTPSLRFSHIVEHTDGALFFTRGEEDKSGYEVWRGQLTPEGQMSIEGNYISGPGGLKPLHYEARLENGTFVGGGMRGGRHCQLSGGWR